MRNVQELIDDFHEHQRIRKILKEDSRYLF